MSSEEKTTRGRRGLMLQGRQAVIGVAVVAVVAFLLGALLFSGGDSETQGDGEAHDHAAAASQPEMWTCSMHPQIQLPKQGKCPICFMDLIPVETGGGEELGPRQLTMSETAKKLARIQTTAVVRADANRRIRLVGKIDYDESRLADITAWAAGRIDKLFVDFTGAQVTAGQPLVSLYSPQLVAAQEELLQATTALESLDQSSSPVLRTTAEETVRATREKLRLLGLTEEQLTEIENSKAPQDHLTITAPLGGVVIEKEAKEGMYVTTGTRIYRIADLSQLWVQLEAYESDLPWLKVGQSVELSSPSFPGESFAAKLTFVDPVIDPRSRTFKVRAELENFGGRLKPDMFVSGEIDADLGKMMQQESELLIPASAPLITGKRAVVYVELPSDDGPLFEGREIDLGPRAGDFYVVESGLQEGEMVVTNGAFKIDSELQIQAKPSMMSPPAAKSSEMPAGAEESGPVYKSGTATRVEIPEAALQALVPVYEEYFTVQMALADDDLEAAKSDYGELREAIGSVEMSRFGEGHERWMEVSAAMQSAAEQGAQAQSIEAARDAFFYLSQAAIELHDTFGHAESEDYYLTFCPMARDNAGAYWLQTVDTVYNSFYGEMMLRCGEIKKPLPAGGGESEPQSQMEVDPLTSVYHAYFRLERALTFADVSEIQSAYRSFAEQIEAWSESESAFAELAPQAEEAATNTELAAVRKAFQPIAEGVLALHEKYGHAEEKNYYLIYCPHALDGGASWLQDVDTMYSPYFGGVMPECTEEKIALPPNEGEAR